MSKVNVVSGKLEVIGPSINKGEGSEYTYLRFAEKSGNVKLVKKVGVGHLVESHMRPSIEGDFYFVKLGRLSYILFAIKTAKGEQIYEQNGFATWIRTMRWIAAGVGLIFLPGTLIGLLCGGFLGGILVAGFLGYLTWVLGFSFPSALKENFLRGQLNRHGFSS